MARNKIVGANTLDEEALALRLGAELGVALEVKVSAEPLEVSRLTRAEAARFNELRTQGRRDSWLIGRAALKRLLASRGEPLETAGISFPNPRFSLTHSGGCAVAVRSVSPGLLGIGVDLEMERSVRPEAARFFLTEEEREWASRPEGRAALGPALLRLWVIKESLFKADPDNRLTGLADYYVEEPARGGGRARTLSAGGGPRKEFLYSCVRLERAFLSVAVHLRGLEAYA